MLKWVTKLVGDSNEREVKRLQPLVAAVNTLEPEVAALTDAELRARTDDFRARLAAGETLDDLIVDAFATVREAARRRTDMRHFDVQIVGGAVLHEGKIAEMKTGEGKTLVATLPLYLNALEGKGAHLITVNDYLAKRDAQWMGPVYHALGLSVGVIQHDQAFLYDPAYEIDNPSLNHLRQVGRRDAYAADITYGTNNEFGFDYLRDNMVADLSDVVQRDLHYAIVDEVDNILIDESRTPLIISGPVEESADVYRTFAQLVPRLREEEDYTTEEKTRSVLLTEAGIEKLEGWLGLDNIYDPANYRITRYMEAALRAHIMYRLDRDYVVKDGEVIIVDDFTGRLMPGRRYSEGLHQAIEAKEGVPIQRESVTLATITFQNYFRLYSKLAGMTGTAVTEAEEFAKIYKLDVVVVPTHKPMIREDYADFVYRNERAKFNAVVDEIADAYKDGQPVLVGTVSIEKSEYLSELLKRRGVPHEVLNAKQHEREAHIVERAGEPGAITIATNMAGRGTDIQLGGNIDMRLAREINEPKDSDAYRKAAQRIHAEVEANRKIVIDAGGCFVIGTERHESRRVDNQLRGRSGRQGDPGASRFFLSLEDDLMRIFGSQRIDGMLKKLGLEEGEAIMHPWVNKALEKAQQKVEARNFEIRKNLLKFDDVMNDQRKVIYEQRKELMSTDDVSEDILDMRHQVIGDLIARCIPANAYPEHWDTAALHEETLRIFGLDLPIAEWSREEGIADAEIRERLTQTVDRKAAEKVANYGPELMRSVEKSLLLQLLDQLWKEHLLTLDHLRQGIGLRAYAQRDPLNEYKREAFNLFETMLTNLRERVTQVLSHVELEMAAAVDEAIFRRAEQPTIETRRDPAFAADDPYAAEEGDGGVATLAPVTTRQAAATVNPNDPATWGRVSRNAPCPCGSGRKYKHCHGKLA